MLSDDRQKELYLWDPLDSLCHGVLDQIEYDSDFWNGDGVRKSFNWLRFGVLSKKLKRIIIRRPQRHVIVTEESAASGF
jgi:hypothetical protein